MTKEDDDYTGEERRACPVGHCSSIGGLLDKNKTLANRITSVGSVSLFVFATFTSIILYLANNTNQTAHENKLEIARFIDSRSKDDLIDREIRATIISQMSQHQKQLDLTTEIQRDLIKSVIILETKVAATRGK